MSIATEKISFSQGLTSYRVKVQSFRHKMNTWKNGRRVFLKEFNVDDTSLMLELYPNGEDQDDVNHVLFTLKIAVKLTLTFSLI